MCMCIPFLDVHAQDPPGDDRKKQKHLHNNTYDTDPNQNLIYNHKYDVIDTPVIHEIEGIILRHVRL